MRHYLKSIAWLFLSNYALSIVNKVNCYVIAIQDGLIAPEINLEISYWKRVMAFENKEKRKIMLLSTSLR